jgi:hypothetical protein
MADPRRQISIMKRLQADGLRDVLEQRGFRLAPDVTLLKGNRGFEQPPGYRPLQHTIWARGLGAVWWGDLNLPADQKRLEALSGELGEVFYVFRGLVPTTKPLSKVSEHLVWWTSPFSSDNSRFVPMESYIPSRAKLPLNYRYGKGTINGEKFFRFERLLLEGDPPDADAWFPDDFSRYFVFDTGSWVRAMPQLSHTIGPLELIWFSCAMGFGAPVWRKDFDLACRGAEDIEFWEATKICLICVIRAKRLVAVLQRARFDCGHVFDAAVSEFEARESKGLIRPLPSGPAPNCIPTAGGMRPVKLTIDKESSSAGKTVAWLNFND